MEYSVGMKVFGDWEIVKGLGEGSFGTVYLLRKESGGVVMESALKVIRIPHSRSDIREALAEGMDERSVTSYFQGIVDSLVNEIAVMTSLKSHPNIVSCEDYQVKEHTGETGWDILIRMELLTALTDYQLSHPMDRGQVLRMGKELAGALEFCRKKGLIHRDVKPANIFVDEFGHFKLGDFGVARSVKRTAGGLSKKGTEPYMAPEVYLGKPYGPSVDIYSLGLVLYRFMNRGRLPFLPPAPRPITFQDRENALARRMKGEPLPPPQDADPALAEVILKACAYRPENRFATAAGFLEALTAAEGGQPARAAAKQEPPVYTESAGPERTVGGWGPSGAWEPARDAESAGSERTVGGWGTSGAWKPARDAESAGKERTVGGWGTSGAWKPARDAESAGKERTVGGREAAGEREQKAPQKARRFMPVRLAMAALTAACFLLGPMIQNSAPFYEAARAASGVLILFTLIGIAGFGFRLLEAASIVYGGLVILDSVMYFRMQGYQIDTDNIGGALSDIYNMTTTVGFLDIFCLVAGVGLVIWMAVLIKRNRESKGA